MLTLHFLNGFFIMNAFMIPPKHFFPPGRMVLWFGFGAIGFREMYHDVETWNKEERKNHPVEGRYRWLSAAVLVTEILTAYKYREGTGHLSDDPTPFYIWFPWTAGFLGCLVFYVYLRFKSGHTVKYPGYGEATTAPAVLESPRKTRTSPRKLSPSKDRKIKSN